MASKPAPAMPAVHTAPKGARTVTVACKFPAGLVLQLCRKVSYMEETMSGGSRERVRYDKVGAIVVVRGPAMPNGQVPKGYKRPEVEGGYALTRGVDADFFEEWLKQNEENPLVVNKMIFGRAGHDHAAGQAGDLHETRSGFEPIEPDTDPRIPRSLDPNISNVETADERKQA